ERQAAGTTVDHILAESGAAALGKQASMDDVLTALRKLPGCVTGSDPALRAGVRAVVMKKLNAIGIRGPKELVDAALPPAGGVEEGAELQGHALTLRDPDPWPDPVDGAELLDEIAATFARFVVLPEGAADALALWTLHA